MMNIFTKTKKKQPQVVLQDTYKRQQQNIQAINYQLITNYTQIIQFIKERRTLLSKKAQLMIKQYQQKLNSISRAKTHDLKNEAKMLHDQSLANLIENSDKINGTKSLLQKIALIDLSSFDTQEKIKGKNYWDKFRQNDNQIQSKNKKYLSIISELEKIVAKQRQQFHQIEKYQYEIIQILTKKQKDYIKKADQLNEQIQKKKNYLKQNKLQKDKKKKQLIQVIKSLLDSVKYHEDSTIIRNKQIQQLYNGIDGPQSFDIFFKNFQEVISNKLQESKSIQINSFQNFKKLINDYQILADEISKFKDEQNKILMEIQDNYRRNTRIALLQKAYLSGISTDKKDLIMLANKYHIIRIRFTQYRKLIGSLEEDRIQVTKQLTKTNQLSTFFYKTLKELQNQDNRRLQLKNELQRILNQKYQLQKNQKKIRNYQFEMSNLELKRKNILMELQQYASKGNLNEYKTKDKELQLINKQIQHQKSSIHGQNIAALQKKLHSDAQILNQKYPEIIKEIIVQQKNMSYLTFINILSKRLSLI